MKNKNKIGIGITITLMIALVIAFIAEFGLAASLFLLAFILLAWGNSQSDILLDSVTVSIVSHVNRTLQGGLLKW